MNYYPFHIGDYLSATRHLSWEEDCAYRRLLDTYYTMEKALPLEARQVCRLVLATTEAQREAVSTILGEFFERTEAGWINRRADAEIAAMQVKQQKQRDKANAMWDRRRAASGTSTPPAHGNASAMPQHATSHATASDGDANAMPPTPTPTPTPRSTKDSPDLLPESVQLSEFAIPLVDNSDFRVPEASVSEWRAAYPAVDVPQELREMRTWAMANKPKRKTRRGIEAFIVRWLGKAQDTPSRAGQRQVATDWTGAAT